MHKKPTIAVDEKVYWGLREKLGPGNIRPVVAALVRLHRFPAVDLEDGSRVMAAGAEREWPAINEAHRRRLIDRRERACFLGRLDDAARRSDRSRGADWVSS